MLKCAVSESGRFGQRKGGQAGSHESCVINPNRLGRVARSPAKGSRQGPALRPPPRRCRRRSSTPGRRKMPNSRALSLRRAVSLRAGRDRHNGTLRYHIFVRRTPARPRTRPGKVEIVVHPSVHIHFRPVGHAGQVDLFHAGVVERGCRPEGAGKGDPSGNPDLGKTRPSV